MTRRSSGLAVLAGALVLSGLIGGHTLGQSSGTRSGMARARPRWDHRWMTLDGGEARRVIESRAFVHSVIFSRPVTPPTVARVEIFTDPGTPTAKVAEILSDGPGQIELDIVVERGLWIRGTGSVTVLYRSM